MYRVLNKKNKKILAISIFLIIVLLVLWFISFYHVNANSFQQKIEHYEMGEWVELDGNFIFDAAENTKGYSICVNSAKLEDYSELMKNYNKNTYVDPTMPTPKYVCLLNISVKNIGNDSGYFNTLGFTLCNGALQIPVDFDVWNTIDESIDGNIFLKLRKDSEVSLTLPFTAQILDEAVNSNRLYSMLENEVFSFYICDFPVRKFIDVKF